MHVLYVDDDRVNALLFEETCRQLGGISVSCAYTGAEALELVSEREPDLLVLDLNLPDVNGYALLPRIRAALKREVPAYLCSADDPALTEQRAQAAGFQGCWHKPVNLPLLMAELTRLGRAAGADE